MQHGDPDKGVSRLALSLSHSLSLSLSFSLSRSLSRGFLPSLLASLAYPLPPSLSHCHPHSRLSPHTLSACQHQLSSAVPFAAVAALEPHADHQRWTRCVAEIEEVCRSIPELFWWMQGWWQS